MHVARIGGIASVSHQLLARPTCLPATRRSFLLGHSFSEFLCSPVTSRSVVGNPCCRGLLLRSMLRPLVRTKSSDTRMEANGHGRQKRKGSPVNTIDRPTKLFKPERSNTINSDQSIDSQYIYGSDSIADATIEPVAGMGEKEEWQATIEQVVKNVVSIHFCQTCSFDTSAALSSEATGFVVDATKGYILTNRHVVGSGPFWGYCIFDNHEEVCYRSTIYLGRYV